MLNTLHVQTNAHRTCMFMYEITSRFRLGSQVNGSIILGSAADLYSTNLKNIKIQKWHAQNSEASLKCIMQKANKVSISVHPKNFQSRTVSDTTYSMFKIPLEP